MNLKAIFNIFYLFYKNSQWERLGVIVRKKDFSKTALVVIHNRLKFPLEGLYVCVLR